MNIQLVITCVVIFVLSPITGCIPIKQWPSTPNRQPPWIGPQQASPAYLVGKTPTRIAEYERFLKSKALGKLPPGATFRPDSWSQYNYHLEKRDMEPGTPKQMSYTPVKSLELTLSKENKTICNISETPNHYCPKTPGRLIEELREVRRGLFSGTTLALLFGVSVTIVYFLSYHFFRYFEYKEKWHVERARLKSIRKINNRECAHRGLDYLYNENVDQWLLDHPPSTFWAGIFENEWFISILYFIERRTQSAGKFTGMMKRPKLGDEASGIPLNSPQARRRYGKNGKQQILLTRVYPVEPREGSNSEIPAPLGNLYRRGPVSRMASIGSMQAFAGRISTGAAESEIYKSRDPSRKSYQMPSGFGDSPWNTDDNDTSSGQGS